MQKPTVARGSPPKIGLVPEPAAQLEPERDRRYTLSSLIAASPDGPLIKKLVAEAAQIARTSTARGASSTVVAMAVSAAQMGFTTAACSPLT